MNGCRLPTAPWSVGLESIILHVPAHLCHFLRHLCCFPQSTVCVFRRQRRPQSHAAVLHRQKICYNMIKRSYGGTRIMDTYRSRMFTEEELNKIRGQFYYVDEDHYGRKRLFFDNAGGSLRLKKAEEVFHLIDSMPDASEHSNSIARELAALEDRGAKISKKSFSARRAARSIPAIRLRRSRWKWSG